jgi:hypothetical protein
VTDTSGVIAIIAAALAAVALIACGVLAVSLSRLRAKQRTVLGERGEQDLVEHGANLDAAFQALRDYVIDVAERIDVRLGTAEGDLRRAVRGRSLVRFDAYNELSGRQSMAIALLDDTGSGIVLSSIHHRDQARLYAKQVHNGVGELELSPEEAEAVRLASSVEPA